MFILCTFRSILHILYMFYFANCVLIRVVFTVDSKIKNKPVSRKLLVLPVLHGETRTTKDHS